MKHKRVIALLATIIVALLAILLINPSSDGISRSTPPTEAKLVIHKSIVGGLQNQPAYSLYDNKRLYMDYNNTSYSIRVPDDTYRHMHAQLHRYDTVGELISLGTNEFIPLGGCNAAVDGIDETWTFVQDSGNKLVADCFLKVDSRVPVINDFEFFARTLWMGTQE